MKIEKKVTFAFLLIMFALLIISVVLWLNAWVPVHATCWIGEDGGYDINGERYEYHGFQKNVDNLFTDGTVLRDWHITIKPDGTLETGGGIKATLWEDCARW